MRADIRLALARWHAAAVAAVQGERVFRDYTRVIGNDFCFERGDRQLQLSLPPAGGRLRVIGLGKAALGMARGFRSSLHAAGRDIDDGLLVIRDLPNGVDEHEPWTFCLAIIPIPEKRASARRGACSNSLESPEPKIDSSSCSRVAPRRSAPDLRPA